MKLFFNYFLLIYEILTSVNGKSRGISRKRMDRVLKKIGSCMGDVQMCCMVALFSKLGSSSFFKFLYTFIYVFVLLITQFYFKRSLPISGKLFHERIIE